MKQIITFFIITCLGGCYGKVPEKTGKEGTTIPSFNLLLTDSTTWLNTSNIPQGQPFGLFIFSPFCPFCRAQTQEIIDNIQELKNIQFYFVSGYPFPVVKEFYKKYQLSKFPNITTGIDTSNAVATYFQAKGIPYLAIYRKDKKLNHSFMGKISSDQIQRVAND